MSFIKPPNSVGICWDRQGMCRAVRLEMRDHAFLVMKTWETELPDADHSSAIAAALQALDADESTRVYLGGSDRACTVCDLRMPRLSAENLRHALLFELKKQCPLPVDQLAWGYRVVPDSNRENTQVVRLFYVRDSEWNHWVENALALRGKVDALMSPAVALDPAFGNCAVQLAENLTFSRPDEGVRSVLTEVPDGVPVLGRGDNPLAVPGLEAGRLKDVDADVQRGYVPAIVLAASALSGNAPRERRNLPAYPRELVPRRYRLIRGVASLAAIYLLVVVAILVGGGLKNSLTHRAELRKRLVQARQKVAELENLRTGGELETELKDSVQQLAANMPRMTQVLAELTDLVPEDYWISKFSWNNGKVELDVSGSGTDFGFIQELEESPLLENVELTDKRTDARGNLVNARIRLYAEYLKTTGAEPNETAIKSGTSTP